MNCKPRIFAKVVRRQFFDLSFAKIRISNSRAW